MTSRELVRAAIEFTNPTRAPRHLWLLPWAEMQYPEELRRIQQEYPSDMLNCPAFLLEQPQVEGDPHCVGRYVDPWGCVFTNVQAGIIGEVKQPIVSDDDWLDVSQVHIPTEWLTVDKEKVNSFCRQEDRWVNSACCPRPFEQLQYIRGTENLYMDMADIPDGLLKFMKEMHTFYCELLTVWAETDVDGLRIMDDWGSQRSLLISPQTWRTLFKPMYRDYAEIAHSHGKKLWMHSDGYILDIYPDLIEIGVDALNSQIFCMGLDAVSQYAGQICFWGEIDRQNLLPYGTEDEIRDAVVQIYQKLWHSGGCIAEMEFGIGAKPQNIATAFEHWNKVVV